MRFLTCFTTFSLIGLLSAVSLPVANDQLAITPDFFRDQFVIYTAKNDIVQITAPINLINYDKLEADSLEVDPDITLFFVEKDKGLYVLKDGKAKQLLANGRSAAGGDYETMSAFFGASDGLYVYNDKTNSADKYGSITDSIIAVEKEKVGDNIYIVTESNEVFKVSDNGEKKDKLDDVPKAKQIVLDYLDNLYFVAEDNKPYVRNADGVKLIEGLPENLSDVKLVRAPSAIEGAAGFVADNVIYILYSSGYSESVDITIDPKVKITAYAPDLSLVQYYASDKKIYEYNLLQLLLEAQSSLNGNVNHYLTSKGTNIRDIASKNKSQIKKSKSKSH